MKPGWASLIGDYGRHFGQWLVPQVGFGCWSWGTDPVSECCVEQFPSGGVYSSVPDLFALACDPHGEALLNRIFGEDARPLPVQLVEVFELIEVGVPGRPACSAQFSSSWGSGAIVEYQAFTGQVRVVPFERSEDSADPFRWHPAQSGYSFGW